MKRIVFSSDDLTENLTDRARFKLWHDIHNASIGSLEYAISDNRPFFAHMEAMSVGEIAVGTMVCSLTRAERGARNIAEDDIGGHNLFVNTGVGLIGGTQCGREFALDPGEAVLMSSSEPLQLFGGDENAWLTIILPDQTLEGTFASANDHTSRRIAAGSDALQLLRHYSHFLGKGPPIVSDALVAHAASTIIDLVGLSLGMKGLDEDLGAARGLRAARLVAITEAIRRHYSDPSVSAHGVARELGLSVRYIHQLLQETGSSFGERVMELRLQKTRQMLADRLNGHLRVSEIALHCGFNDISYFNRSFRRRFGCTPVSIR